MLDVFWGYLWRGCPFWKDAYGVTGEDWQLWLESSLAKWWWKNKEWKFIFLFVFCLQNSSSRHPFLFKLVGPLSGIHSIPCEDYTICDTLLLAWAICITHLLFAPLSSMKGKEDGKQRKKRGLTSVRSFFGYLLSLIFCLSRCIAGHWTLSLSHIRKDFLSFPFVGFALA